MATVVDAPPYREEGFDRLYHTYRQDVHRLATRLLRNAVDAEDAAQTVFLNVLRALRQGVQPGDARAWLYAITRNVCTSRQRAGACRPEEVELDPELVPAGEERDAAPTSLEIVGALARMLPNQRAALYLRDFRGASRAEIGDLLGLSPAGVEALLARARASFREELEAGETPLPCGDVEHLIEQQLEGLISAGDRHALRTHLRHCAPCSRLARVIRSTSGRLASLLWPSGAIERLAALFGQAPAAAHVASALSATVVAATAAIPVAIVPAHARRAPAAAPSPEVAQAAPASRPSTPPARALPVAAAAPEQAKGRRARAHAHRAGGAARAGRHRAAQLRAPARPAAATPPAASSGAAAPAPVSTATAPAPTSASLPRAQTTAPAAAFRGHLQLPAAEHAIPRQPVRMHGGGVLSDPRTKPLLRRKLRPKAVGPRRPEPQLLTSNPDAGSQDPPVPPAEDPGGPVPLGGPQQPAPSPPARVMPNPLQPSLR